MTRTTALIATASIIALLTAACADGRPSGEELTAQVTEICQTAGERHQDAAAGFDLANFDPTTSDLTEIVPLIEQNVAIGRETSDALDRVDGPEDDVDTIDRWIAVNAQIAANATRLMDAAGEGNAEEFMQFGAVEEDLHQQFPAAPMFEGC